MSGAEGNKGSGRGAGKAGRSLKDAIREQERRDARDRFVARFLTGCLTRRYRLPSTEEAAKMFETTPDLEAALAVWGKDRPYGGPQAQGTDGIKNKVEDIASRLRAQLRARRGPRRGRAGEEA